MSAALGHPAKLTFHGGDVDHKLPGVGGLEEQGLEAGDQQEGGHGVDGEGLEEFLERNLSEPCRPRVGGAQVKLLALEERGEIVLSLKAY